MDWRWEDNSPNTFYSWNSGEPSDTSYGSYGGEFCVEMFNTGFWNDKNCDDANLGYICKGQPIGVYKPWLHL